MDFIIRERINDAFIRIMQIPQEKEVGEKFQPYFTTVAKFLEVVKEAYAFIQSPLFEQASMEDLKKVHDALYAVAKPEVYEESYLNPDYAVKELGLDLGRLFSYVYSELLALIPFIYEKGREEDIAIRLELFIELYCSAICVHQENKEPIYSELRDIVASFAHDYQDMDLTLRYDGIYNSFHSVGEDILMNEDLSDLSYLYKYGEYISDNEVNIARFINSMPQEKVDSLAKTYTEGYRIGFEVTNKDISKKEFVGIYYPIGFERIIRQAVLNFREIGLNATIFRRPASALDGRGLSVSGFVGTTVNKQLLFDHDEDSALWVDKAYLNRRLETVRNAHEKNKYNANHYGGPAVVETFGEDPFNPVIKENALHFSDEQQALSVQLQIKAGAIVNEYVKGEERSFTIISFPVPEIGDKFEEIFEKTVEVNTLDYELYRDMQQIIIDVLDKASCVEVKGMNGNETELTIALHELADPSKETNFENCVADVNIPVGEVFTSPKLKGTNGILHVTKVFLDGLEYNNLRIELKDGMVGDYSCTNFEDAAQGKKYIKDNILSHHETIPIGEFAIGTNTVAYKMARDYDIADRLTILIAEKTGPHFALGDTCYSHEEEVESFNPDGKKIVAKSNEVSENYKTDPSKAYFQCHTDITIPYDELGSLTAVCKDGTRFDIIRDGKFVLEGLEELNKPLD